MSQEVVDKLTNENAQLKKSLEVAVAQANDFVLQLDAHKQMLSEAIQSALTLRTNFLKCQRQFQDLSGKFQSSEKALADANAKIAELSSPPA